MVAFWNIEMFSKIDMCWVGSLWHVCLWLLCKFIFGFLRLCFRCICVLSIKWVLSLEFVRVSCAFLCLVEVHKVRKVRMGLWQQTLLTECVFVWCSIWLFLVYVLVFGECVYVWYKARDSVCLLCLFVFKFSLCVFVWRVYLCFVFEMRHNNLEMSPPCFTQKLLSQNRRNPVKKATFHSLWPRINF